MKKFFNSTILTLAISTVLMASAIATAFATPAPTSAVPPTPFIETEADTSIETEVDTTVETEADTTVETEADTTVETEADTTVETEANTTVETEADTTVETEHHCTIIKANTSYHRYSCDECENYSYVLHNEDYMSVCVENEFFHTWACECGYGYAENHNFRTGYNENGHYDVCIDCGYTTELVPHVCENDFWSYYHDTQCSECAYVFSRHIGVNYVCIDDATCQATCRECSIVVAMPHDWDGFVCDNCDHVISGDTYAIVKNIYDNDDGSYYVSFVDNTGTHRIDMWNINFEEDDFVKINHYGNTIFDTTVIVDGDIVNDVENFYDYISDEIIENSEELEFEDLIIDEFEYGENKLVIDFESGRSVGLCNFSNYVVYDLLNNEMSELEEAFAYLRMYVGDTVYFICIW